MSQFHLVEALESLDGRLSAASRRVVGRALPSAASLALPPALKARLQALTRRWTGATNLQQLRKEPRPPKAKAEARPAVAVLAAPALTEDMRSKFVGILMRRWAKECKGKVKKRHDEATRRAARARPASRLARASSVRSLPNAARSPRSTAAGRGVP